MILTATTKRSPAAVAGKIGAPVAKLTSLTLSHAPVPVHPDTIEKYQLKSPRKAYQTGAFGLVDVLEGDILTTNGVDYHVRAVGATPGSPVEYTEIIMEQVS